MFLIYQDMRKGISLFTHPHILSLHIPWLVYSRYTKVLTDTHIYSDHLIEKLNMEESGCMYALSIFVVVEVFF